MRGMCDSYKLCLCRNRLRYMDGSYGELDAPPTVPHHYFLLEEATSEASAREMASERQKTLREDAIRQERKQLKKGLEKLETDKHAREHWASTLPWRSEGDNREFPVGTRVLVGDERDALTIVGHGPHGTYNLARFEYGDIRFCTPPTKVRAIGSARSKRAAQLARDSDSD